MPPRCCRRRAWIAARQPAPAAVVRSVDLVGRREQESLQRGRPVRARERPAAGAGRRQREVAVPGDRGLGVEQLRDVLAAEPLPDQQALRRGRSDLGGGRELVAEAGAARASPTATAITTIRSTHRGTCARRGAGGARGRRGGSAPGGSPLRRQVRLEQHACRQAVPVGPRAALPAAALGLDRREALVPQIDRYPDAPPETPAKPAAARACAPRSPTASAARRPRCAPGPPRRSRRRGRAGRPGNRRARWPAGGEQ